MTGGLELFGKDLARNIISKNWQPSRCKSLLRLVVSRNLDSEWDEHMLSRELNPRDDIVHIEHIFPKKPIQAEGDDRHGWIESFFDGEEETVQGYVVDIVESHVEHGREDQLLNLSDEFSRILGNHLLLLSQINIQISNDRYGEKLAGYVSVDGFEKLSTSKHIRDMVEDSDWEDLESYGRYKRYEQEPDLDSYSDSEDIED
jgi:hypothetical protein